MFRTIFLLFCLTFSTTARAETVDRLANIIDCFETNITISLDDEWDVANIRNSRAIELEGNYILLHGTLGWHMTWGILFDFGEDKPTAYETFGGPNQTTTAFGQVEIPETILAEFEGCGVTWGGFWEGIWPSRDS